MVVAQVNYTTYITLVGTLAEVVGALNTNGVPKHAIVALYWNGTSIDCVYRV